jgi:hypothetical protein
VRGERGEGVGLQRVAPALSARYDRAVALLPEVAMKKKWLLILFAGVVAVSVVVVLLGVSKWKRSHDPGRFIDREHWEAIQEGMSQAEVEALLGQPPGEYLTAPVVYTEPWIEWPEGERAEDWAGNEGLIRVYFDEAGKVEYARFSRAEHTWLNLEWLPVWLQRLLP